MLALIFALPSRAGIINEVLIAGLFALSLDLILGLAGIVSLGHAAFLGLGAYAAAILASKGLAEPMLGLAFGAAVAALAGLVTAPLLLRGGDLTRLMVTLGVSLMLGELANRNSWLTGGTDGLNFSMAPVLGLFPIGFTGQRNAALYSFAVLFFLFAIARRLARSPFGLALAAIRENRLRAGALGDRRRPPHRCDLYGCGGLRGRGGRPARADDPDRVARPVRFPPIGRRHADAHHRRHGIPLRRPDRRGGVHRAEGRDFRRDSRILGILDRSRSGHSGVGRPRAGRGGAEAADRPPRAARCAERRGVSVPALEARGLVRRFGALTATDDVSFTIEPGARQALIGPNGAGKTTLINLLTGVIKPTAGQVLLQGRDVTRLASSARVRLGLSRTFQINQLFPDLTPAESVGLAISERNGSGADFWRAAGSWPAITAEIAELLMRFGLEAEMDQPTRKLAYGKQRLLEIALALATRPRVLLLDEPAAGVPEEERRDILAALAALPSDVAILLIEHDMDLVFNFAERISVLVAGRLMTEGAPEAIAADERVRAVYLGEDAHG